MLQGAPWSLGKFGYLINGITFVWIVLATILFCMPTTMEVEASTMNYASVVFSFFFVLSAAWWFAWGSRHYVGPLGAAPEEALEHVRPGHVHSATKPVVDVASHDSEEKEAVHHG